jgi:hypothetical protein
MKREMEGETMTDKLGCHTDNYLRDAVKAGAFCRDNLPDCIPVDAHKAAIEKNELTINRLLQDVFDALEDWHPAMTQGAICQSCGRWTPPHNPEADEHREGSACGVELARRSEKGLLPRLRDAIVSTTLDKLVEWQDKCKALTAEIDRLTNYTSELNHLLYVREDEFDRLRARNAELTACLKATAGRSE